MMGGKLTVDLFRKDGRQLIWISIAAALGTTMIVALTLLAAGVPLTVAILMGCIAAATAPAVTADTVMESRSNSRFSRLLLGIVAIDDVWALLLFSLGLALVALLNGIQGISASLLDATYEIFGALLLGGIIGLLAAKLTGRIKASARAVCRTVALAREPTSRQPRRWIRTRRT